MDIEKRERGFFINFYNLLNFYKDKPNNKATRT